MGVDEQVVKDVVDNYFQQEPRTRSKEVSEIVRQLTEGEKDPQGPAKGNNDLSQNEKYLTLLENHLVKTLQFMSWTENLSFEDITYQHGVSQNNQRNYIRLFIELRRFLGYGVGDTVSDKPKMDEQSGKVKFGVGGEAQSLQGPKIQSSSIKGASANSKKCAVVDQRSRKSKKSAPLTQPADVEFGGEASFQKEYVLQSSGKERVNTSVVVTGKSLVGATSALLTLCLKQFGKIKHKGVTLNNKGPNPHAFITYEEHSSQQKALKASRVLFADSIIEIKEKGSNKGHIGESSDSSPEDKWNDLMEKKSSEVSLLHQLAFEKARKAGPTGLKEKNVEKEMFHTFADFKIVISSIDIVDLVTKGWLNIDLVTWVMTSLKKIVVSNPSNKCDFLAPFMLEEGNLVREEKLVQNYLMKVKDLKNNKIYLAPYHSSATRHWNLFILAPHKKVCYILDSDLYSKNIFGMYKKDESGNLILKKSLSSYALTKHVKLVFPDMKIKLVKTCNQQNGGWECAYYVIRWMNDMTTFIEQQELLYK